METKSKSVTVHWIQSSHHTGFVSLRHKQAAKWDKKEKLTLPLLVISIARFKKIYAHNYMKAYV